MAIVVGAFLASTEYPALLWAWPVAAVLDGMGGAAAVRFARRASSTTSFSGAAAVVALLGLGVLLGVLFFVPERVIGPLVHSSCASLAACDASEAGRTTPRHSRSTSVSRRSRSRSCTARRARLRSSASFAASRRSLAPSASIASRLGSEEPLERLDDGENPLSTLLRDDLRSPPKPLYVVLLCTTEALERTFIGWLPPLGTPRHHTFKNPFTGETYQGKTREPTGPWPDEFVVPDTPGSYDAVRIRWDVPAVFAAIGEDYDLGEFDLIVPEIETPVLYRRPA